MKPKLRFLTFVTIALGLQSSAHAVDFFWDGTDSGPDANGGSGTWDAGLTTNWDDLAIAGNSIIWPSSSSGNDDAFFGGTAGTVSIVETGVTANSLTFNTAGYTLQGGGIALDGTAPSVHAAADAIVNSVLSGSAGLVKSGTGNLTLGAANTYTGTTSITGGTLTLSGGANRLATSGIVSFAADGTLNLGGNSQTLANLSTLTASASTKGTLSNGSLTLNGASALTISPSLTTGGRTAEIDASGLSSLTISKSGQNITVGGIAGGLAPGSYGIFKLSAVSNSITASAINVGTTGGTNAASVINRGEMQLGASNTIYANSWKLGTTRDGGIVQFQSGLTTPSVTLRGQNGTDAVTSILIGENSAGSTGVGTSHLNLSAGSVDILVTTLTISRGGSGAPNGPAVNGSFSMGAGTLTANQIWLSKNESGGLNTNTSSFTQGGGTVKVTTLTFGQTTAASGTPSFNAQYTLNGGTLNAGAISAGTGVFNTGSTRRINFNGGTITTLDADTNLTINGVTGTGGSIGLVLGTAGSPTFDAGVDRTITLGAFTAMSGSGSLTKTGAGTLAINSASTYTGSTTINGGSISLGGADRLPIGTNLTLANTAGVSLNLNNNNQTVGSLAGGGSSGGNISIGTATFKVGNANNTTFGGQLTGTGSFVKVGSGALTLSGNSTMSLAGMNISGGSLELTSGNYTVTGSAGTGAPDGTTGFVVSRGATFRLNGGNVSATGGSYVFTAGNTGGNGNNFILDSGTFDAGSREVLNAYGSSGTFTMNGGLFVGGDFRISQSAAGTVNLNGGVLRVVTLKSANNTEIINFNGGTVQAKSDRSDFITAGVDQVNILENGAFINSNGFAIAIPNPLLASESSPGGGLTKLGAGSLTLSGSGSTYTGETVVSAGTLIVDGNISTSLVTTVENGASLAGSGTVGNLVIEAGGSLNPGNSPGILNVDGDYTQAGTLVVEINGLTPGTEHDQVNVDRISGNGLVSLSGSLSTLFGSFTPANNDLIFILFNDGDDAINGTFNGLSQGDTVASFGGFDWQISYQADSTGGSFLGGNDIALMAVPEPGTALMVGLGALGVLRRRRMKAKPGCKENP